MKKVAQNKKVENSVVNIEVGEAGDFVQLNFDKEVTWIQIKPTEAIRIAEHLKTAAIGILRSTPE